MVYSMLILSLWISSSSLWATPKYSSSLSFLSDSLSTTYRTDTVPISTSPFSCTATVDASLDGLASWFSWQADDCGGISQDVALESFSEMGQAWTDPTGIIRNGTMFLDIPPGLYRLLLFTSDACDQTATDTLHFTVVDQIAPRITCRNNLTLGWEGGGSVSLQAADFGSGSNDNCGSVELLIRRAIAESCIPGFIALGYDQNGDGQLTEVDGFSLIDGVWYTPWAEAVPFLCCDVGFSQVVHLKATDGSGNESSCSQTVRIEDRQELTCRAPLGIRLGCNDPRLNDLNQLGTASPRQNDCGTITMEELPVSEELDDCGAGTIIRSFQAVKYAGTLQEERSPVCHQTIQVINDHHYSMCFPADTTVSCVRNESLPGVAMLSDGCELFAVTQNEERIFSEEAGTGCYQLRRTFQVINWCEYDGSGAPVVVGRDWDEWNGTNPQAPTGNGEAGDRPICVTIARFLNDVFPDTVWYDTDINPHNRQPAYSSFSAEEGYYWRVISGNANPDSDVYYSGNGTTWGNNPRDSSAQSTGYGSNGFWQYTQIITVEDETPPAWNIVSGQDTFMAVSGSDCSAEASFLFELSDDCLLNWDEYSFSVSLDLNKDGREEEAPYLDLALFPKILIAGRFPLGNHQLRVTATDLCGQTIALTHPFVVVDRRAPRPVCINGLTVELEPAAPGDSIGPAGVPIFVDNFVASSTSDCSGEVQYSINLIGEGFTPGQDGLVLTCADLGTVVVEIHAWDKAGNRGSCETYVLVQDREEPVCHSANLGYLSGLITTPDLLPLPDAAIQLTGPFARTKFTDEGGSYSFANLQSAYTYQLTPVYDRDYINGVSTYDIYLIQQHILGVEPFSTPYQYIAADANRSGTVSVADMVQIRKLVLSVDVALADNTSWRFVDARHTFGRPERTLTDGFPERVEIADLPPDSLIVDFTAVKVGDVSGNALTEVNDVRSLYAEGSLDLLIPDKVLQPGKTHRVPLRIASVQELQSLQFALSIDPQQAHLHGMEGGLLTEKQIAVFAEAQTITTAWVAPPAERLLPDTTLITLLLAVDQPVALSEVLSLNARYTPEEAIIGGKEYLPALRYTTERVSKELMQAAVYPNPVLPGRDVLLTFTLNDPSQVNLQVVDGRGKVLTQKQVFRAAGRHEWAIPASTFAVPGWYALRLTTANKAITLPLVVGQ